MSCFARVLHRPICGLAYIQERINSWKTRGSKTSDRENEIRTCSMEQQLFESLKRSPMNTGCLSGSRTVNFVLVAVGSQQAPQLQSVVLLAVKTTFEVASLIFKMPPEKKRE